MSQITFFYDFQVLLPLIPKGKPLKIRHPLGAGQSDFQELITKKPF